MFEKIIYEENVSRWDDLVAYPEITDEETLCNLVGVPVIISQFENVIDDLFERFIDIGVRCWNNKTKDGRKLQQTMIEVRKTEDSHPYYVQFNRLIVSLAYIMPVIHYLDEVDFDAFLLTSYHTENKSYELQEKINAILSDHSISITDMQEIMANMLTSLKTILKTFSHADMPILTAENLFLDHYMESEIIREINNTWYPQDMQPSEIIEKNKEKYETISHEMTIRHNPIYEMNKYTKLIKPKQIEESLINFGYVPDGRNLVSVVQNGNGCWAGYNDILSLYVAAIGARVPDLMNTEKMGDAGYFSRNLMINTYGTISPTVTDCGSRNKLRVELDEVEFELRQGRYYSFNEDPDAPLRILKKTDKNLIGKTLWFRSPAMCNLNEDCCHVCYGTKGLDVANLTGGFIYTTEILTSRISQNILSAKHILKANAEKVEFSDNFDKYFEIESSMVFPIDDKPFDIYIPEDFTDDISEKLVIYIKKNKNLEPVTISHYRNCEIPDDLLEKCKEVDVDDLTYLKISSAKILDVAPYFCTITPINIMETQKYDDIKRLVENELPKIPTVEEAVSKMNHYTHKIIPILAAHNEIIIGNLLRRPDNILLRPNWKNPNEPYKMLRLRTAIENAEAVTVSISFEKVYDQLHKKIFDERNKINRVGASAFADFTYGLRKNY